MEPTGLDVRVPVSGMFATMGALLVGYGAFGDHAIYAKSLGLNINLIWGAVLLAFAIALLGSTKVRSRDRF